MEYSQEKTVIYGGADCGAVNFNAYSLQFALIKRSYGVESLLFVDVRSRSGCGILAVFAIFSIVEVGLLWPK